MPTPDQPNKINPSEPDDGLYELANDPDADQTPLPPAYQPPPQAESAPTSPTGPASPDQAKPAASLLDSEEPAYVSDEVKARRREEQRIAAMANATEDKWWQQKWVRITLGLLILLGILYWIMLQFSDAVEDGLHKTMRPSNTPTTALIHTNNTLTYHIVEQSD